MEYARQTQRTTGSIEWLAGTVATEERLLATLGRTVELVGLSAKTRGNVSAQDWSSMAPAQAAVEAPQKAGKARRDPEARHTVKRGQPHYGYKAHIAAEALTGMIRKAIYTPANVFDGHLLEALDPGDVPICADKAYYKREREQRLGKRSYIMHKGGRGCPLSPAQHKYNASLSKLRGPIERIFGHWKRNLGYCKCRLLRAKSRSLRAGHEMHCVELATCRQLIPDNISKATVNAVPYWGGASSLR